MSTEVTPSQLRTLLAATIPAHLPVMISGAPGIGKSDIVAQACADAGAECIVMHPVVSDPTDFKGLPWVVDANKGATFLPFGELSQLINASKLTACFLDDLGQASPAVQAAAMQLILARKINGHHVSPHVVFLSATNRRTDKAGVSGILEPVKSRHATIVELKPNARDWRAWAAGAGIAGEVIAYLGHRPDALSEFKASSDLVNTPSPRTWAGLSRLLALNLPTELQLPVFTGAIGELRATEFTGFLRVWQQMVHPDVVLTSPDTAPIPTDPAAAYALVTALATRVERASMSRYIRYLDRLLAADKAEYAAVSIQTASARKDRDTLTNTDAYVRAMAGDLGKLLIGGAE